jgi:hypothetical protein
MTCALTGSAQDKTTGLDQPEIQLRYAVYSLPLPQG